MHIPEPARLVLTQAFADGVVPGATAALVDTAGAVGALAVGRRQDGPDVTLDTRYDLASLTKVVVTLPSVLRLVAAGEIGLDDPVGRFFSSAGWFQEPSIAEVTVRALLTHTSGLPA